MAFLWFRYAARQWKAKHTSQSSHEIYFKLFKNIMNICDFITGHLKQIIQPINNCSDIVHILMWVGAIWYFQQRNFPQIDINYQNRDRTPSVGRMLDS